MPSQPTVSRPTLPFVFVLTILGLGSGMVFASWKYSVVYARSIAGIVPYPQGSIMEQMTERAWSLINQIEAVFLVWGLPEPAIALGNSAVTGLLYLTAFTALARAVGASRNMALLIAIIHVAAGPGRVGPDYKLTIAGTSDHGILGLAVSLLAVGLAGTGRLGLAGFLAGVGMSLHAVIGAATIAALAVPLAIPSFRPDPAGTRRLLAGLALGLALAAGSYIYCQVSVAPLPVLTDANAYRDVFLSLWDLHRNRQFDQSHWLALLYALTGLGAACWLAVQCRSQPRPGLYYPAVCLTLFLGAIGAYVVFFAFRPYLPAILIAPMPSRLINIANAAAWPLLAGVVLARPSLPRVMGLALMTAVALAVDDRGMLSLAFVKLSMAPGGLGFLMAAVAATVIWAGVERWNGPARTHWAEAALPVIAVLAGGWLACESLYRLFPQLGRAWPAVASAIAVLTVASLVLIAVTVRRPSAAAWRVAVALPFLVLAYLGPLHLVRPAQAGLLSRIEQSGDLLLVAEEVTIADIFLMRRPVLIYPETLDFIPYLPAAGKAVADILADIYGIDYFDPPRATRFEGGLMNGVSRATWESRTPEQWACLSRKYGFRGVIARSIWRLQLPEALPSEAGFSYFTVDPSACPEGPPSGG